ncbi:MAG TPA: glutathione transferase GstA [Rheinheimera sp.]|nr:glutathione transferase GstA [Rheinheimera sp.]
MKLFYAPGACSLASHIALEEAGLKFEIARVNLRTKQLTDGSDYRQIQPFGYVPALQLKNGEVLTEGPAILQYIADQAPGAALAPVNGSFARYRLQSALNFIGTELHKNFSPLFDPSTVDAAKDAARARLDLRLTQLQESMSDQPFMLGDQFTIADAYLFVCLNWSGLVGYDLSKFDKLTAYVARVAQRPSVQAAMRAEGLIKN